MGPRGVGDLADIKIAVRIHGKRVRRDEGAIFGSRARCAKPSEQFSRMVQDGDARTDIRISAVDVEEGTELTDEEDGLAGPCM